MEAEVLPKNKGTKQLFKNPILEKLSRTHISVPLTIFFLYSSVLLYWSIANTSLNAITTVYMGGVYNTPPPFSHANLHQAS
jgi:hypothetical protein